MPSIFSLCTNTQEFVYQSSIFTGILNIDAATSKFMPPCSTHKHNVVRTNKNLCTQTRFSAHTLYIVHSQESYHTYKFMYPQKFMHTHDFLFNSPVNLDFENVLIFNPGFNIGWEKAKTVNTMTCALTCQRKAACIVNNCLFN